MTPTVAPAATTGFSSLIEGSGPFSPPQRIALARLASQLVGAPDTLGPRGRGVGRDDDAALITVACLLLTGTGTGCSPGLAARISGGALVGRGVGTFVVVGVRGLGFAQAPAVVGARFPDGERIGDSNLDSSLVPPFS